MSKDKKEKKSVKDLFNKRDFTAKNIEWPVWSCEQISKTKSPQFKSRNILEPRPSDFREWTKRIQVDIVSTYSKEASEGQGSHLWHLTRSKYIMTGLSESQRNSAQR